MDRRELLGLGVSMGALAATRTALASDAPTTTSGRYARAADLLDQYVAQYLRDMNAPGLTLALADADGVQRVCAYGFDDLTQRVPLNTTKLFQIGSITKSFVGLCLLQLHDAGRLDLQRPIQEYLPWLRFDGFTEPLTAHALMTHAGALPDGQLYPADPAFRHRATANPGAFFHYCNMGWEALGSLLEMIDGRPLAEALRERILVPLGMTSTEPTITLDMFERLATSYQPAYSDRPFPRQGLLTQSGPIAVPGASGCIAATTRDMGAYLAMLINRGTASGRRIVSQAAFDRFMHPHIAAEEFGPGASYGYGIAVDRMDGHARLMHTGGMVSFASALQVDLDAGVGAFASINAMQGFRPTPVAEYALRLMRACREESALPEPPPPAPALKVAAAADYAGSYAGAAGRVLQVIAAGERLYLMHRDKRVPLEPAIDPTDAFTVLDPDYALYALLFTRSGADGKGPVVEAGWGADWYAAAAYQGPRTFHAPDDWSHFIGHYRNEDPWFGSVRVVSRRGRLWMNGVIPLEPAAGGRYYLRDEPASPEWLSFSDIVNGHAMQLHFSGNVLQRV